MTTEYPTPNHKYEPDLYVCNKQMQQNTILARQELG
jgi:hypothetical protein